eukprot:Nk52_evm23s311 gene=Nk52_evmTU23s311
MSGVTGKNLASSAKQSPTQEGLKIEREIAETAIDSISGENEFAHAVHKIALDHCYALSTKSLSTEPYNSILLRRRELEAMATAEAEVGEGKGNRRLSKERMRKRSTNSGRRDSTSNSPPDATGEKYRKRIFSETSDDGEGRVVKHGIDEEGKANGENDDFKSCEICNEEASKSEGEDKENGEPDGKRRKISCKSKEHALKILERENAHKSAKEKKLKEKYEREQVKAMAKRQAQERAMKKARMKMEEKETRAQEKKTGKKKDKDSGASANPSNTNSVSSAAEKKKARPKSRTVKKEVAAEEEIDIGLWDTSVSEPWVYDRYEAIGLNVDKRFDNYYIVQDEELQRMRSTWLPAYAEVFDEIVGIVNGNYLVRLAQSSETEAKKVVLLFNGKSAERLRTSFGRINWNRTAISWAHARCLELLTDKMLAIYIDILRCLHFKIPVIFGMCGFLEDPRVARFPSYFLLQQLLKSGVPTYFVESGKIDTKDWKFCSSSIVILGPSCIPWDHPYMVEWAEALATMGKIVKFDQGVYPYGKTNACALDIVEKLKQLICKLRNDNPNKKLILVGQFTRARLACFAALEEKVKAIICLGYPLLCPKGILTKEPVLRQRCPVFFILGSKGASCPVPYFQKMCKQLKAHNLVHTVSGGDDLLRIPFSLKYKEHIVQKTAIIKAVSDAGNFLEKVFSNPDMKRLSAAPEKPPPKRKRKKDVNQADKKSTNGKPATAPPTSVSTKVGTN